MSQTTVALEHLRIIRSLMERAHIYRALSSPAALCGGVLAVGVSLWQWHGGTAGAPWRFLAVWHGILGLTAALNIWLLAREAARRGQPFISEGMRLALRSFFPPMLVGGCLGLGVSVMWHQCALAVILWTLCYGLALLATASFSPRSLIRLGWAFVVTGLAFFLSWARWAVHFSDEQAAAGIMGLTFGLLHILYAGAVFCRRPSTAPTLGEPTA
jgi:hypothetical protein